MKDYRLSEIKAICEKRKICKGCRFYKEVDNYGRTIGVCEVCDTTPKYWQIDKENEDDETEEELHFGFGGKV